MKAVFLNDSDSIDKVFSEETKSRICEYAELFPQVISSSELEKYKDILKDTEFVFSTWGMPSLSEEQIDKYLPSLKAVFYAAGTVQAFARPFLNKGITVTSAWVANGIPVAEMTLALILLANKGFYRARYKERDGFFAANDFRSTLPGNYDVSVGILGAGTIGKRVIEFLKPHRINVKVFDPFLADEKASELGVEKCSLEEVFSTCLTVSNHLANNENTKGMLNYRLFSMMNEKATFINTGRGAQVIESDLVRILSERLGMTAILDVAYPNEPPLDGNELYKLDNVVLAPHMAGSSGLETRRMGEYACDEFERFVKSEKLIYSVSMKMLETMA